MPQKPGTRETTTALGFEIATDLTAAAETVWAGATSMAGVERELRPLCRMTYPAWAAQLTPQTVVLGQRLFRSWILLFGIVPVEYDDLTFVELEPGRRFLERSPTLTQRIWQHERIIASTATGCTVTDRLQLTPRLPGLRRLQVAVVRALFRTRHRNLRRFFGTGG